MSPQQLLRETERAAGDENLTTWHDSLITSGRELKNIQEVRDFSKKFLRFSLLSRSSIQNASNSKQHRSETPP
jgi:hypothetical protein